MAAIEFTQTNDFPPVQVLINVPRFRFKYCGRPSAEVAHARKARTAFPSD